VRRRKGRSGAEPEAPDDGAGEPGDGDATAVPEPHPRRRKRAGRTPEIGAPAVPELHAAAKPAALDADAPGTSETPASHQRPRRAPWRERVAGRLLRLDTDPRLLAAARGARGRLPGDERYGDPLSTGGTEPTNLIGQRIAARAGERLSAARELGLGALQLWQALAEVQGRGHGSADVAILFTDVVGFSTWALDAGDGRAVELLRRVARAVESPVAAHGGTLVKRMGDGHMAVFEEPERAVAAAREAVAGVAAIELAGYRPRLRAGIHAGSPRRLGGDYFGVDVNVAARVGAAAGPGEVLISSAVRDRLTDDAVPLARGWRLGAKGTPDDLEVYAVG
jgi:adenylate cyclase